MIFEILFWLGLTAFVYYYITRKPEFEEISYHTTMSLNNAVLVLELKDIDGINNIWYVGECHNPESTVKHIPSLADFIFASSCYEDKEKAAVHATVIHNQLQTKHGVLFYNGYSKFTFGQLMSKYTPEPLMQP